MGKSPISENDKVVHFLKRKTENELNKHFFREGSSK